MSARLLPRARDLPTRQPRSFTEMPLPHLSPVVLPVAAVRPDPAAGLRHPRNTPGRSRRRRRRRSIRLPPHRPPSTTITRYATATSTISAAQLARKLPPRSIGRLYASVGSDDSAGGSLVAKNQSIFDPQKQLSTQEKTFVKSIGV